MLVSKSSHERVKRGAVRPTNMLWPDGIIYYKFSPDLGKDPWSTMIWRSLTKILFVAIINLQCYLFLRSYKHSHLSLLQYRHDKQDVGRCCCNFPH